MSSPGLTGDPVFQTLDFKMRRLRVLDPRFRGDDGETRNHAA
jgi:hypothetical protein